MLLSYLYIESMLTILQIVYECIVVRFCAKKVIFWAFFVYAALKMAQKFFYLFISFKSEIIEDLKII